MNRPNRVRVVVSGRPLTTTLTRFGRFIAPHLLKIAEPFIDPSWRTLELVQHTESIIHRMVRQISPGASPPVLETVRVAPDELHMIYSSRRRLCVLATGIMRGIADHYREAIAIEETSCMLRGDAFCSFAIKRVSADTVSSEPSISDTQVLPPPSEASATASGGTLHDDLPPAVIGGHPVIGLIGSGAMGRVYLARDEQLDRRVAIKVLNPSKARDPSARLRFVRESRAAAAVEHPNVLAIYAVGEEGGLPYIVMQYLEGRTLRQVQQTQGKLSVPEVLRIGRQIADGLAAAHRRGLVHRDIKPDNVFIETVGRNVRIIDFGLARETGPDESKLTQDGSVVGTPAYMPPERIADEPLDAQSDLFGLGVILYELLSGKLPFEGSSLVGTLAAISKGNPVPLHVAATATPPGVCDLVMRLIAYDKAARPRTAEVVSAEIAALERFMDCSC